jgi:hypothetical protein
MEKGHEGVLHVHRRQRMQTCHLANMIWPIAPLGTILKEMSSTKKLNVTVLFVWYMFIIWNNNMCEIPLATCVVVSHYMSRSSPSCYLRWYHIIFESTSTYDIVFGSIYTYDIIFRPTSIWDVEVEPTSTYDVDFGPTSTYDVDVGPTYTYDIVFGPISTYNIVFVSSSTYDIVFGPTSTYDVEVGPASTYNFVFGPIST